MDCPTFYLIDGHAVAYRQYFGLPLESFSTRAGEPTNATYGFTRILLDLIQNIKPDYLAVSFDMGLSGRDEIYDGYKGTRERMPDELVIQMDRINEVVKAFNIPILALEGYEADDIIGTVAPQIEAQNVDVHIITGDRDLLQLLTDHVVVQLPGKRGAQDVVYDVSRFVERYTIQPDQLVDLKALMGDTSDNIPGVNGIGEKTGVKLLLEHRTLEHVYDAIETIKGATRKKLENGREMAFVSQDLARIRRDVPIQIKLEDCVSHDFDPNTVLELFRELEFRSFADRLVQVTTPTTQDMFSDSDFSISGSIQHIESLVDVKTVIVDDEEKLETLVETLNNAEAITWDVETTGIDQMAVDLVGIAIAVDGKTGYYIPVGHNKGKQLSLQQVMDALHPSMTNQDIPKFAHNASYDLIVTARHGIEVIPVTFDTMIAEWLRNPVSKHLGLKNLARHALGVQMTEISHLIGKGKKQKTMNEIAIDDCAAYAAADAAITHRLAEYLKPELEKEHLLELNDALEIPLIPVLVTMQRQGITLDVGFLHKMSNQLEGQLNTLEQQIYAEGGYGTFNINSPKQLNEVLFDKLGLPVEGLKKTTHGYSTDVVTLEKLKADTGAPIINHILDYRELSKLKSTYVDALPTMVNPHTGRVHTNYNQTGAATGRISSNSPNLQNIPIRTEAGREVRAAFIASAGHRLLAVDYSQIELRVLAHISQDETLLKAFAQGQDIHKATAAAVYGVDVDDVTYEQRSFAKRVNFGLIYGMGAFRLARDSDLTLAEAEKFIETYFNRLPNVEKYINDTKQAARNPRGLSTLFGRKRHFASLEDAGGQRTSRQRIQAEERAAINMPIQGTAADIMKKAMIDLYDTLNNSNLGAKMILQVHDELVLEVAEDELHETCELVVHIMENAYTLDAPLKANAQIGINWRDMENMV